MSICICLTNQPRGGIERAGGLFLMALCELYPLRTLILVVSLGLCLFLSGG